MMEFTTAAPGTSETKQECRRGAEQSALATVMLDEIRYGLPVFVVPRSDSPKALVSPFSSAV